MCVCVCVFCGQVKQTTLLPACVLTHHVLVDEGLLRGQRHLQGDVTYSWDSQPHRNIKLADTDTHTRMHMHATSSFRPRRHVLECPCETLNTSLSATVVPDIDCDPLHLTPAGSSCHTWSLVSHDFSFSFFFFFLPSLGRVGGVCLCVHVHVCLQGKRCVLILKMWKEKDVFVVQEARFFLSCFFSVLSPHSWPAVHILTASHSAVNSNSGWHVETAASSAFCLQRKDNINSIVTFAYKKEASVWITPALYRPYVRDVHVSAAHWFLLVSVLAALRMHGRWITKNGHALSCLSVCLCAPDSHDNRITVWTTDSRWPSSKLI